MNEIEILKKINHPNIINVVEIIDDPKQDNICIVMDYIKNGAIVRWDKQSMKYVLNPALKQFGDQ